MVPAAGKVHDYQQFDKNGCSAACILFIHKDALGPAYSGPSGIPSHEGYPGRSASHYQSSNMGGGIMEIMTLEMISPDQVIYMEMGIDNDQCNTSLYMARHGNSRGITSWLVHGG